MTEKFNVGAFMASEDFIKSYQVKYAALFQRGMKVLDIGCGVGYFLEILRDAGIDGIGLDTEERAVRLCREKNLQAIRGEPLPFLRDKDEEYDGIFCSHVIEHLQPADAVSLLIHGMRALRANGLFIVITPNVKNIEVVTDIFWRDITHVRPYPRPLLEELLKHAGFHIRSSGIDKDTNKRIPRKNPVLVLRFILDKIRFGEYFGRGDTYVVARKPDERMSDISPDNS